jgi:hypothetical protein
MALRDKGFPSGDPARDRLRRKANQEWDMAGLARQDGDAADAERHTKAAREYERQLRELS